jgi:hypothetical protein
VNPPNLSPLGAMRNTRDADIAIADREYREACQKAWHEREQAVVRIRQTYRSKRTEVSAP